MMAAAKWNAGNSRAPAKSAALRTAGAAVILLAAAPSAAVVLATAACSAGNTLLQRARTVTPAMQALGDRAVELGVLNAPLQMPKMLLKGVPYPAWRDDARTWHAVQHLEKHFVKIRQEALAVYGVGDLSRADTKEKHGLHYAGRWDEIDLLMMGAPLEKNINLLPYTSRVIMELRDARSMVHGGTKISVMEPGTLVRPHTGLTNARMRIHLGLNIPKGVGVRVNGETRTWIEGKCIVFDDSYVHEVWHNGTEKRIVLIVDIWNPGALLTFPPLF